MCACVRVRKCVWGGGVGACVCACVRSHFRVIASVQQWRVTLVPISRDVLACVLPLASVMQSQPV